VVVARCGARAPVPRACRSRAAWRPWRRRRRAASPRRAAGPAQATPERRVRTRTPAQRRPRPAEAPAAPAAAAAAAARRARKAAAPPARWRQRPRHAPAWRDEARARAPRACQRASLARTRAASAGLCVCESKAHHVRGGARGSCAAQTACAAGCAGRAGAGGRTRQRCRGGAAVARRACGHRFSHRLRPHAPVTRPVLAALRAAAWRAHSAVAAARTLFAGRAPLVTPELAADSGLSWAVVGVRSLPRRATDAAAA
jgi:hypothetical protein